MFKHKWCCYGPEWAGLVLRLFIGFSFVMHGSQKVLGAFGGMGIAGFSGFLTQIGVPMPHLMAYVAAYVEFIGGICLILGLGTCVFSALIGVNMLVAIFLVHWKNGFFAANGGFELPFAFLGGCLALMCLGCHKWGLDCLIRAKYCKTDTTEGSCCS